MTRSLSIAAAIALAWLIQGLTWSRVPKPGTHQTLVETLALHSRAGDEVAWLPGWEQRFALELTRQNLALKHRLGDADLMRPFARLWLLSSADAPSWPLPEGVRIEQHFAQAGYRADLLIRSGSVEPIAWPQLGACAMGPKKHRCYAQGAQVAFTELAFDGSFAQGFKIKLGRQPMTLRFAGAPGAELIGGLGSTSHGARHAKAAVRVRWNNSAEALPVWSFEPVSGMRPVRVASRPGHNLELVFESDDPRGAELALSVGWWTK